MLIVAKVVDDLKMAGIGNESENFLNDFHKRFELGSANRGPGSMRFFGINISQDSELNISTDASDKLDALSEFSFARSRRKEQEELLNDIEKSHFASINSSLGWIGSAASPLCSFYASYLQQKAPKPCVKHLVEQNNILRSLKKHGTTIRYLRPEVKKADELTLVIFADASKSDQNGQIGVLCGLMFGNMSPESVFHLITWVSHKAKRPVKSVPAAEILAAGESIDEGKVIKLALVEMLGVKVNLHICIDSKDLFFSMSTHKASIDKSIRSDVGAIRYDF